ncbi:MAG: ribonuclease HI [Candidatus Paceibacterota bacterium]|jgi:ribonuclease HI
MNPASNITIFTDGSSRGNPGPGGWGAIIVDKKEDQNKSHIREIGGSEKNTTNNRMELTAVLRAIGSTANETVSTVYTDSSYVINGITKWIHGWKRNGWQTKAKEDVLNKDLWEELDRNINNKKISWKYVGGHVGIAGNERCDLIATGFADGIKVDLYDGPLTGYKDKNILNISLDHTKATDKKSKSNRSKAKAYSYISSINGKIEIHKSWPECEKRVKGARGARYKKALSPLEEAEIVDEFK